MKTEEKCGNKDCGSKDVRDHCNNPTCTWKKCTRCLFLGDPRRPHLPWRFSGNTKD